MMMMQKNRIELAGYTGSKATVRYLPSGTPVANVRMAEGYRYTDRNNQTQEHTNWHSLVFYGDLAEIAALYEKGDNIFVEGTLQTRQFTPKDGSQRTVYEVVARTVHHITRTKSPREVPADNNPQVAPSSSEPGVPPEVEANAEVWPS